MVCGNRGSMRIKVLGDKKELSIESHQNQNLMEMLLDNRMQYFLHQVFSILELFAELISIKNKTRLVRLLT